MLAPIYLNFLYFEFLQQTLSIRVNIYRELAYINCLFLPLLEAVRPPH